MWILQRTAYGIRGYTRGRANNGAYKEAGGPDLKALFNGLIIPRIQKPIYEDTHPTPFCQSQDRIWP